MKKRILFLMTCLLMMASLPVSASEKGDKANSFRYRNGKEIPTFSTQAISPYAWQKINGNYYSSNGSIITNATGKGIDVSYHNGVVDWAKVKASGIDYAIIRCGIGMNQSAQDDQQWSNNVTGCEQNNIPYGVYLYSYADTTGRAKSEAEHVLRLISGHKLSYPVYYDMEEDDVRDKTTAAQKYEIAKTFCDTIKAAGYQVSIYASKDWFTNYLLPQSSYDQWGRWVAQYNSSCTYTGAYQMWQATDSGYVDGVTGKVDINFNMIKPPVLKKPTITLQEGTKKLTVKIKNSGSVSGYQIQYSKKSSMKGSKTVTVKGKKKILKKLSKKKKYYVRVRSYKIKSGKTYYSSWSKKKAMKTK